MPKHIGQNFAIKPTVPELAEMFADIPCDDSGEAEPEPKIIVGVCREDDPADVDEAYGTGTYARMFPSVSCEECGANYQGWKCARCQVQLCDGCKAKSNSVDLCEYCRDGWLGWPVGLP